MKRSIAAICVSITAIASAQEKAPAPQAAPAAVQGVKGVKQDSVEKIKNPETGITPTAPNVTQGMNKIDGVQTINGVKTNTAEQIKNVEPPPTANATQGMNKIDGVQTINGVKAEGQAVPVPVQPVVQPVITGAGSIQAINGVTGINAPKLQNLEAALQIKDSPTGPPTGKAKAAAGLLGAPLGKPAKAPKEDGRAGFQEFEKLQNAGS